MKPSRGTWLWAAAGVLIAGAVALVFLLRRPGEPLTEEALRAAERRWGERGPRGYALDVKVDGVQHGRHAIRVRDGKVVAMTTGGAAVPENVWTYWTVEGMFRFLAEELDNSRQPLASYGVSDPAQVVLRADFDPELGYPRAFMRHVMGGRPMDIAWSANLTPDSPANHN